jgi:hypothetical protein
MGSMDSPDHGYHHSHQRQHIYIAAVYQRKLPKISGADSRHSRSKLLFRVEGIDELRPQKYSSESSNDSRCISRSV